MPGFLLILLYMMIGALVAGLLDFGPVDYATFAIGLLWPIAIPVFAFGITIKWLFIAGRKIKIKVFGEEIDEE